MNKIKQKTENRKQKTENRKQIKRIKQKNKKIINDYMFVTAFYDVKPMN